MPGPARSFDESEVVDAAVRAFWEKGFEGTSLSTVLEEVGIGRQSLYNAFESKEALYVAALRRYRHENIRNLVVILDGDGSPAARLDRVFEAIEATIKDGDCGGCFVANAIAEFGKSNQEVRDEIERSCTELSSAFERTLVEARSVGELPAKVDPKDVAALCMTLVEGVSLLNRVQSNATLAGSVRRAIRTLLVG